MKKETAIEVALPFISKDYYISELLSIKEIVNNINQKIFYSYFYEDNLRGYLIGYMKDYMRYIFVAEDLRIILTIDKIELDKKIILKKE